LEGRPDSSQPVQGSLGFKQRVAVVAPPKDPDTMTRARSEAVSMISTFRFRKDKGGFADLGPVTIQTALVTGSAATTLKEPKAQAVAEVQVTGTVIGKPIPTELELADDILRDPKTDRQKLKELLKTPCKDMTDTDKADFKTLTGVVGFRVSLCEAVKERQEAKP
ncbi:MAG: hypothetical protein ACREU8_06240, partial [Gammaproteobacteria bacterium]